MREAKPGKIKSIHPHAWLWEPLQNQPSFVLRPMFGAKAVYLHGKLMLCFIAREEPWRGILVATEHQHHASLRSEFAILSPHPILPKWLYLPESVDAFEQIGERLVALAGRQDPRLGVVPPAKKRKRTGPRAKPAVRSRRDTP
jgi:hypothetical protein